MRKRGHFPYLPSNAVLCRPPAVGASLAIGADLWLQRTEYFWKSPIADARFQLVTDFDGIEQAAAVSRDGQFVAFLSDRDGKMDVWVTPVGSGQFHNLTRGSMPELLNPSVRTLGFSPDGSLIAFWVRRRTVERRQHQHREPCRRWADQRGHTWKKRPSSTGRMMVAGSRTTRPDLATRSSYRTASGDPIAGSIFTACCRAPLSLSIAVARRGIPVLRSGRASQTRWTSGASLRPAVLRSGSRSHVGRVSHPVLLDRRTLVYLAGDADGSGPWLIAWT